MRRLACRLVESVLFGSSLFLSLPLWSQQTPNKLAEASLEDLLNIQVTSVSKREEKLSRTAAAVFVITQEDIRRSGATNIPDLLRVVPGLEVAQINANTWAISARGFNSQYANKLLVLIDGRDVYTPLFGGVYWDAVDVPLEDIDRIEVIRGPGGTVWGANAVNGVINIITKSAADTQGGLATAGGGNQAQGFGTVQYGGKVKKEGSYRIFSKYLNENHLPDPIGQNGDDGWHLLHGGFRVDTDLSAKDSLITEGDIYDGREGAIIVQPTLVPPANVNVSRVAGMSGGSVFSRWTHTFSSRFDTTLQFYFDSYDRDGPRLYDERNTLDFDFQSDIRFAARHDLSWGLGYRHMADQAVRTIEEAFTPPDFSGDRYSGFVQDQITLASGRLALYVGSKFENDYFTNLELEPSARLAWTPTERRTFWAAVSRANRTPTRIDEGLSGTLAVLPGPAEVAILGNPNMKSEDVVAYEFGYREEPSERVSFDVALFFNFYKDLETLEPSAPFLDLSSGLPVLVFPTVLGNRMYGTTQGLETAVNWKITHRWTLAPGYAFLNMNLHTDPGSLDASSVPNTEGSSPKHHAQLRSHIELPRSLSWDANAYFVSPLPFQAVRSYTRLDSQLSWRVAERVELSLVGQNLLRDRHLEFNNLLQSVNSSLVKRSAYAKLRWQF